MSKCKIVKWNRNVKCNSILDVKCVCVCVYVQVEVHVSVRYSCVCVCSYGSAHNFPPAISMLIYWFNSNYRNNLLRWLFQFVRYDRPMENEWACMHEWRMNAKSIFVWKLLVHKYSDLFNRFVRLSPFGDELYFN